MTSKERLQEYIDKDEVYQNFLKGNKISSDFDMFCIQHCNDIEELLKENQKANDTIDTNLELIDHLEKQLKICSANDKFLVENGIITKQHKEIKRLEQELSETEGKLKRCGKKKQQVEDKCSYYKWIIERLRKYMYNNITIDKEHYNGHNHWELNDTNCEEILNILDGNIDE